MDKFELERLVKIELKKLIDYNHFDKWFDSGLPAFNFQTPRHLIENDNGEVLLNHIKSLLPKPRNK